MQIKATIRHRPRHYRGNYAKRAGVVYFPTGMIGKVVIVMPIEAYHAILKRQNRVSKAIDTIKKAIR